MLAVNLVSCLAFAQARDRLESRIAELEQQREVRAEWQMPYGKEPVLTMAAAPVVEAAAPVRQSETFTAYAYCSCRKCCGKWAEYGLTASGTKPVEGRTVAVDPEIIPLGTTVWVDGVEMVAEDTGSGIGGYKLDVYHESHQAAVEYGVRAVTVEWEG